MKYLFILLMFVSCTSEYVYEQQLEIIYCRRDQTDKIVVYTDHLVDATDIEIKRHKKHKKPATYDMVTTLDIYDYRRKHMMRFIDICGVKVISHQIIKK